MPPPQRDTPHPHFELRPPRVGAEPDATLAQAQEILGQIMALYHTINGAVLDRSSQLAPFWMGTLHVVFPSPAPLAQVIREFEPLRRHTHPR